MQKQSFNMKKEGSKCLLEYCMNQDFVLPTVCCEILTIIQNIPAIFWAVEKAIVEY